MSGNSAQRVINVIRTAVDQGTENGARVRYMPAVIRTGGGGYQVSAYVAGNDVSSDYIRQPSGVYTSAGDYVMVGITDNDMWVEQQLPTASAYAKMAFDYNNARVAFGDGTTAPGVSSSYGSILRSGGDSGPIFSTGFRGASGSASSVGAGVAQDLTVSWGFTWSNANYFMLHAVSTDDVAGAYLVRAVLTAKTTTNCKFRIFNGDASARNITVLVLGIGES